MINNLRVTLHSMGTEIKLRVNRDDAYDDNKYISIYLFRKERSDLTSAEVDACKQFIAGAGPKPTGIQIHKWFWYDDNGDACFSDRYANGNRESNRHMDFFDFRVDIGRFRKREKVISGNDTTVTVGHNVAEVYGIWSLDDSFKDGAEYYEGGSYSGKVITLGSTLPSSSTDVYVEYLAEYDDATEYFYRVMGYDSNTDAWDGDESASAFATYDYAYVVPDVIGWVITAVKKMLAAKDLRQIPVLREFPHKEQTTFFYVSEGAESEIDSQWADAVANSRSDGQTFGRIHMTPVIVEWATPDHRLTHAIKSYFKLHKMLIHQHIIRQKGYYSAYSPKFELGPDQLLPAEQSGGDKPLYMGSMTIQIPSYAVEDRAYPFSEMTDFSQKSFVPQDGSSVELQF